MKAFVISMDLMLSIFVIMIAILLLMGAETRFESDYPVASDALSIIQKIGWSTDPVELNQTLYYVIPHTQADFSIHYYQAGNMTNNSQVVRVLKPAGIADFEGDVAERMDVVMNGDWVTNFAILRLEVQE